jgi:hypothetical protein
VTPFSTDLYTVCAKAGATTISSNNTLMAEV